MEHRIRHDLGSLERAREVVEKAYAEYKVRLAEYKPTLEWSGETSARIGFTVMNKSLGVDAKVTDQELIMTGKLPLLFRPFQGKIIGVVDAEVRKWIERARTEASADGVD